jgi:hypothetical protein
MSDRYHYDHRKQRFGSGQFDGGFGDSKRVDPYAKEPFLNPVRVACFGIGLALVTPFLFPTFFEEPEPAAIERLQLVNPVDPRIAWKNGIDVPGHRLVGLGCGAQRLTMTAREEDEFPTCEAIDGPADMCPTADGSVPTAGDCARYMGDGW